MENYSDESNDKRLLVLYLEHRNVCNQIAAFEHASKDDSAIPDLMKIIKKINSEKKQLTSEYNNATK